MSTSDYTSEIPYGYCQCGCGQKTEPIKQSDYTKGRIKGHPSRYLKNHYKPTNRSTSAHIALFWKKVAITADDEQCWLWLAGCASNGYGQKSWNQRKDLAHRVSWMIVYGDIPDGLFVLHKCDNPKCVNPKHLFLGTHQQNMDDMNAKGRRATGDRVASKGESHPRHKLTNEQVKEIRQRYASGGLTWDGLAHEYDMSQSQIGRIIHNEHWKELS